jgi:hypothetical protein
MQFFTPEWATGELSEDEYEATPRRYADHVASLKLPENILELAETSLHDGLVERIVETPGELSVILITGDLQRGYWETTITYTEPLAWGAAVAFLQSIAANADADADALEHEVDRLDDRFIHRISFSTDEEIAIEFTSASVKQQSRNSRTFAPLHAPSSNSALQPTGTAAPAACVLR